MKARKRERVACALLGSGHSRASAQLGRDRNGPHAEHPCEKGGAARRASSPAEELAVEHGVFRAVRAAPPPQLHAGIPDGDGAGGHAWRGSRSLLRSRARMQWQCSTASFTAACGPLALRCGTTLRCDRMIAFLNLNGLPHGVHPSAVSRQPSLSSPFPPGAVRTSCLSTVNQVNAKLGSGGAVRTHPRHSS